MSTPFPGEHAAGLPGSPARPVAPTLTAVLRGLVAEPGRPRLTWYGPDGERVELSGHVLDNWVTKTTNLLVEELDVGPGRTVLLDLPAHWRTVLWALAVWRTGACVLLASSGPAAGSAAAPAGPTGPAGTPAPDVVVTARPELATAPGSEVVVVALPALARSVGAALPPGAIDAAAAVMTYGDALGHVPPTDPAAAALRVDGAGADDDAHTAHTGHGEAPTSVLHGGLVAWALDGEPLAAPGTGGSAPHRVLLEPADERPAPVLRAVLAAYATGGSVVLCAPSVAAELAADPQRRARLVAAERITG